MQNVCYQRINDTFSYGQYLTFKVVINTKTGYVNATKLCKDHGKQLYNWTSNSTTQQLIKSFNINSDADGWLSKNSNENILDLENSKNENQNLMHGIPCIKFDWSIVEKGGNNDMCRITNGTYIHPRLLPALGMWISPQFYFLAAEIIENFAIRSFKRANYELETKLKQVELQCNQLNEQLDKERTMLRT